MAIHDLVGHAADRGDVGIVAVTPVCWNRPTNSCETRSSTRASRPSSNRSTPDLMNISSIVSESAVAVWSNATPRPCVTLVIDSSKRFRVQIRHGDRDADDRAEQTQNRNGPDDDPDHGVGRIDAGGFDFLQMAEVRFEGVGRVLAADEIERVAQSAHDESFTERGMPGQLV